MMRVAVAQTHHRLARRQPNLISANIFYTKLRLAVRAHASACRGRAGLSAARRPFILMPTLGAC